MEFGFSGTKGEGADSILHVWVWAQRERLCVSAQLPKITSVEQTLQEPCLHATVPFGVQWCKSPNSCAVQWAAQKDSAGTKSNGTVPDTSRISSAYFKIFNLLIEIMLQHLRCLQNTVQMCTFFHCEYNTDEGQMQMKAKPCHTSVVDGLCLFFRWGSRGECEVRSWLREAGVTAAFKSLILSAAFKQRNPFSQRIMHSSAEHTLLPGDYGLGRAQALRMVNSWEHSRLLAALLPVVKLERSLGLLCTRCYLAEADE